MKYKSLNDFIVSPPKPVTDFFSKFTWHIDTFTKELFLTFDDGPVPELTEKVLDILDIYEAKATFFCVGDNVKKYPEIYQEILFRGHSTGNHTYSHLNGFKTGTKKYIRDIQKAAEYIDSPLFRPPYGKITRKQWLRLRNDYKIILWDVLSQDYAQNLTAQECTDNIRRFTNPGSVIVFHDSYKAEKNMLAALTASLIHYTQKGYRFRRINYNDVK